MRTTLSKTLTIVVVLCFVLGNIPAWAESSVTQAPAQKPTFKNQTISPASHEILVKFKPSTQESTASSLVKSKKDKVVGDIEELDIKEVKIGKNESVPKEIKEYEKSLSVEYAEPNYEASITATPNDTLYDSQWSHSKISSPQGWDVTTGNSSTTIAIVDTGVDYNHPDLAGKVINGYDFANNDNDAMDDHGHGTHCAGIAAAATNNSRGVAGVSWGSKTLAVKVLTAQGYGYYDDIADGITYAANYGADVISLSLGGTSYSYTLKNAVDYAYSKGCVIVAAAGNSNNSTPLYPAAYDHVIAVAATDSGDKKASFSNYGSYVDVAAPGVSIMSTLPNNSYASWSGTSMATPNVAGLATLIISNKPNLTNDMVESQIEWGADDLGTGGKDDYYGYGRINVYKSVALHLGRHYWSGWDIAKDIGITSGNNGHYVLDGYGGIHSCSLTSYGNPYWQGWNIARALAVLPNGAGYYVLDGYGGVHAQGSAQNLGATNQGRGWGWDIGRDIAVTPSGNGYYILDGFGGIHTFGDAQSLGNPYWPGWDIANALAVLPNGSGYYILDGWGGVHTQGSAQFYGPSPGDKGNTWPGWDIARDIAVTPSGNGYYVLDGWGGVHAFGDAQNLGAPNGNKGFGFDVARKIVVTPSGNGYYILDGYGGIHVFGDATLN